MSWFPTSTCLKLLLKVVGLPIPILTVPLVFKRAGASSHPWQRKAPLTLKQMETAFGLLLFSHVWMARRTAIATSKTKTAKQVGKCNFLMLIA